MEINIRFDGNTHIHTHTQKGKKSWEDLVIDARTNLCINIHNHILSSGGIMSVCLNLFKSVWETL